MTAPTDFRQYALDCMREAENADDAAIRLIMLGLARIWMDTALEMDSVILAKDELARKDDATTQSTQITPEKDEAAN
jgi:hypothetical protein